MKWLLHAFICESFQAISYNALRESTRSVKLESEYSIISKVLVIYSSFCRYVLLGFTFVLMI